MSATVDVTFVPAGVTVAVPSGTTVLEAARRAGVPLAATCGGAGTCGDCAVRVVAGEVPPPSPAEAAALASAPPSVRLACLLRPTSAVTVRPVAPVAVVPARTAADTPRARAVSAAVDLGTTTITVSLLDDAGMELSSASTPNPQLVFGGDVASRIAAALAGSARELRDLAARGVADALALTGADLAGVARVAVACNTVMAHLALGAEVSGLAGHPYEGVLSGTVRSTAGELGLQPLDPRAAIVFLPPMAAFVGGDATAGVLATGIDRTADVRLLVDLGTNAEVIVSCSGELTVSSAAAGPAFEAAGLGCGGPARPGAISGARIEGVELVLDVIGGAPAASVCGSGALATVGALLEAGHLDTGGRLLAEGPLQARFHHRGGVLAVQLAGEPGASRDVYLSQLDIRELQLAKAAVATALELTLARAGVGWDEVAAVLVAGAFGAGIDVRLLRRLGVLPAGAEPQVVASGDTALSGAEQVAHYPHLEARAEEVAARARGVDLAADPAFQRAFIGHTRLAELP